MFQARYLILALQLYLWVTSPSPTFHGQPDGAGGVSVAVQVECAGIVPGTASLQTLEGGVQRAAQVALCGGLQQVAVFAPQEVKV